MRIGQMPQVALDLSSFSHQNIDRGGLWMVICVLLEIALFNIGFQQVYWHHGNLILIPPGDVHTTNEKKKFDQAFRTSVPSLPHRQKIQQLQFIKKLLWVRS